VRFVGHNGQVETDSEAITIKRKGFVGVMTHAFQGEKRIPYSSITSVQFRPAGILTNGYIQFGVLGGNESRGALLDATRDENSVLFRRGNQEQEFRKLRAIVEEAVAETRLAPVVRVKSSSLADELTKLADLRDRGAITNAEFEHQKVRLLGS
jgi:hypothetical protein